MQEEKNGVLKWIIIAGVIIILLAAALFIVLRFAKNSTVAVTLGKVLPFGESSLVTVSKDFNATNNAGDQPPSNSSNDLSSPYFRQLTDKQIAGATSFTRDGKAFVRYVLREKGYIFEIDTTTWSTRQLTNTVIPRVYEASFGRNGEVVILRYLENDTIKTYVGKIVLPQNMASSTDTIGEIRGKYFPDNISSVTISPDGAKLFYLLPNESGVVGFVTQLSSDEDPREVFRNSFSEWLTQLLDTGKIILTTKPSANIAGFAYSYNPVDKHLTRIVREKNGLTTLGNNSGGLVLFSENIAGNSTMGIYSEASFSKDEGKITHETSLPITSLPEKCVWGNDSNFLYCGSFSNPQQNVIPDSWYQGLLSFDDTFWIINPLTNEIRLLADPQYETQRNLDVYMPFLDNSEKFFFFTDKHTGFLWSMRIEADKFQEEESTYIPPTPEEAGDAAGSSRN